jgi:hypothetical protein
MKDELEKIIIDKHPEMFTLQENENPIYPIKFGMECNDGWFTIIDELTDKIAELDTKKEIKIFQIKEKFGGLRYYLDSCPEELYAQVNNLIDDAEEKSYITCETCGKPGIKRGGGWISIRCDECEEKANASRNRTNL